MLLVLKRAKFCSKWSYTSALFMLCYAKERKNPNKIQVNALKSFPSIRSPALNIKEAVLYWIISALVRRSTSPWNQVLIRCAVCPLSQARPRIFGAFPISAHPKKEGKEEKKEEGIMISLILAISQFLPGWHPDVRSRLIFYDLFNLVVDLLQGVALYNG